MLHSLNQFSTHSTLESHPVLFSVQGCSQVLLGHTRGINCCKASVRISVFSWAHSTLQLENVPTKLQPDQCSHKLIQQLNLFLGRFERFCVA